MFRLQKRRINQLKKELIQIARLTSLNSYDTLRCSQKLDELITIYQNQNNLKNKTRNHKINYTQTCAF
ncbi:aspartyl-phosphate phosphatase Spo0E family protein [Oceanobacillus sp. J11TS1]|uniref:aspartyl-phosphate phosphatase Spo0E family protein n=1 Tax=Oceanobacillus sp. J11TS1 TaxID=2807191 RepID=UPI002467DC9B|nr:aspartyl-phosphate phosphatase Spo0E family protein [Oceanobacillus sp. J11TS1]